MLPPKVGGSAYSRYCLRDPVASSTGVPKRVRDSAPPAIRSSPVTVGPAFVEVDGDREPRAPPGRGPGAALGPSIVSPSAARCRGDREQQRGRENGDGGEQAGDAAARDAARTGHAGSWTGVGYGSEHRRAGSGKSCNACIQPSTVAARSGGRPAAPIVRCIGPGLDRVARAPSAGAQPVVRAQRNPCPTSDRSAPSASIPRSSATWGMVAAPPYDVIGPDLHRSLLAREPDERRPAGPAARGAPRGPRRALSARRADARGLALRRHAAQGPAARLLRLRAGLPGAGHRRSSGPSAGSSPASASSRSAPTAACCRTSGRWPGRKRGPLPAAARDRRQHVARRRACIDDPTGAAAAELAAVAATPPVADVTDDDGVRHRLWVVADEGRTAPSRTLSAVAAPGAGLHRRRPPPVRDGPALSRRAAHDAARASRTRRSTSCSMLLLDADEPLDGPADAPRRARPGRRRRGRAPGTACAGLFEVTADRPPRRCSTDSRRRAGSPGGEGRFGFVTRDARVAAHGAPGRVRAASCAAGGDAVRALDVTLLGGDAGVAGRDRCRRRRRRRADPLHEVRRRGGRARRARATDGADAAFLLEPTPVASILDVAGGGRRHAPEVDLLLPQGPHRAGAQPPRVVSHGAGPMTDTHLLRPPPRPHRRLQRAAPSARTRSSSSTAGCTSSRGCPSGGRDASRSCSSTASSAAPGCGSDTSTTSPAAAGRATPSTCATTSGRTPPIPRRSTWSRTRRTSSRRWSDWGRRSSPSGTAWAACWCSRPSSACPASAYVLIAPEPPQGAARPGAPARRARRPRRLRARGDWAGRRCPRSCCASIATSRSPTCCGSSTCWARSRSSRAERAARCSRACRSTGRRCPTSRASSSAAGWTPYVPEQDVERLAEWLDAPYEPFGAHSHYGLVLGEQSYLQVAETLRDVPRDEPPLAGLARGRRPTARR